jgi:hypothetical protein
MNWECYIPGRFYFEINQSEINELYKITREISMQNHENLVKCEFFFQKKTNSVFITEYCNVSNFCFSAQD